jgi:hypothetical protein
VQTPLTRMKPTSHAHSPSSQLALAPHVMPAQGSRGGAVQAVGVPVLGGLQAHALFTHAAGDAQLLALHVNGVHTLFTHVDGDAQVVALHVNGVHTLFTHVDGDAQFAALHTYGAGPHVPSSRVTLGGGHTH